MLYDGFDNWFFNEVTSWSTMHKNLEYRYDDGKNQLELEMPGVKKETVSVKLIPRQLAVNWTDRNGKKRTNVFAVDKSVVDATAKMEDGVLTVTLKVEEVQTKTIKVE